MADSKIGLNAADDLKLGTLQVDKIYLGTNEIWSNIVITADPTVVYNSKAYTTITWRYTNTDTVAAHIWAKIDSGSYVDLGEVAAGGYVDKQWTGLTHNTTHNTTCYAIGVPAHYVASGEVTSANVTTNQYTTANPSWVSNTLITETTVRVTYTNNDASTALIYITVNGVEKSVSVGAGTTGYQDFTGLTHNTSYTPSAYAQVSGEIASASVNGTSFTTDDLNTTATPSYYSVVQGQTQLQVYYQNNDGSTADIEVTLNSETKTITGVVSGGNGSVTFTGLDPATAYSHNAKAQASGEYQSGVSSTTVSTTLSLDTTAVPSYSSDTVTETTARVYYTNNDGQTADIDITMNGETKTASGVASGATGYQDFTGLTHNTTYPVTATAQASGELESASSASTNVTTDDLDTTAVPSWSSNTLITHNSVRVTYTNNDASTATVYIIVNGVEKSVSIGAGATGYQDFNGLVENTAYTSTAKAQASGEYESAASSSSGTSFTTAVQTQTDAPTINDPYKVTTWKYTVKNNDAGSTVIYSDYDGTNPPTTSRGTVASGANTSVIDTGRAVGGFTIYARAQTSGLTMSDTVSVYVPA